jgi:hypothetical protein
VTEQKEANVHVSHGLSDRHWQEQTIDTNADGEMSPVQVTETLINVEALQSGLNGVAERALAAILDYSGFESSNENEGDYEDIDHIPGRVDENAEEDMGQIICKSQHIDSGVRPLAPGGVIKESE